MNSNYELHFPPEPLQYNPVNGQFLKGHIPHNKGKKWSEWMDGRKQKKVIRIGTKNLRRRYDIGGWNKRAVIMICEDGSHFYFESSFAAERSTGICARNIRFCCNKKRKHAGKCRWFWFDDPEVINLIHK